MASAAADVEGLEGAGQNAVVELGEGAEGDRHEWSPFGCSQGPSLRCLGAGDREGAADTASAASGRSTAEDLGGGENLQRSGREEAGLLRPGKFLPRRGWGRRLRDPAVHRDMQGRTCRSREEANTEHPSKRFACRQRAPNLAQPSRLRRATNFGRHATMTSLGLG